MGGVKSSKVSPDKAMEMMKRMGTSDGEKMFPNISFMRHNENGETLFKFIEILTAYQLRGYAGQSSTKIQKMVEKAMSTGGSLEEDSEDNIDK
jgi:hypothetical protein